MWSDRIPHKRLLFQVGPEQILVLVLHFVRRSLGVGAHILPVIQQVLTAALAFSSLTFNERPCSSLGGGAVDVETQAGNKPLLNIANKLNASLMTLLLVETRPMGVVVKTNAAASEDASWQERLNSNSNVSYDLREQQCGSKPPHRRVKGRL